MSTISNNLLVACTDGFFQVNRHQAINPPLAYTETEKFCYIKQELCAPPS